MPGDELFPLNTHALLEALGDAVIVADAGGILRFVNGAVERLLGWTPEQLLGRPLLDIVPPSHRVAHEAGFSRFLSTRQPVLIGQTAVRVPALRSDGSQVDVELSLTAHDDLASGRTVFVASLRDLSERLALEREQARTRYLDAMSAVTRRIDDLGVESIVEASAEVLEAIAAAVSCQVGIVWTPADDALVLAAAWAAPGWDHAATALGSSPHTEMAAGVGVPGRVLRGGSAVWVGDLSLEPGLPRTDVFADLGIRSCFAFPVISQGQVAAVVELLSAEPDHLDAALIGVMSATGAHLGRILDRATSARRERDTTAHLVEMATALQASLLPPLEPRIPGLDLAVRYQAASGDGHVGGDFVDTFALADGGWALAVGDVSGRGPKAAALAALARYTLRAAAVAAVDPGDALRVVNEVIVAELERLDEFGERFLTIAFATVQPSAQGYEVRTACGGHPSPLVRQSDGSVEELGCSGDILGSFTVFEALGETAVLTPGDAIVIVTDGVLEARRGPEEFGGQGLKEALSRPAGNANEMADNIVAALHAFTPARVDDDVAIAVLRVPLPVPAASAPTPTAARAAH